MAPGQELYHTLGEYQSRGLAPFVEHAYAYMVGQRTVPVTKVNALSGNPEALVTFSNDLLRRFVRERRSMRKPYDVVVKYGFRGHSVGGKNGIFYQRDEDQELLRSTDTLVSRCQRELELDLGKNVEQAMGELRKVKIVWHNPCGERIVGLYDPEQSRILFLGLASY